MQGGVPGGYAGVRRGGCEASASARLADVTASAHGYMQELAATKAELELVREALRQCYVELHYCAQKFGVADGGSIADALTLGDAMLMANQPPYTIDKHLEIAERARQVIAKARP